tara:strand:- start:4790 stop:5293 length:504 start_codon:yes stop_codon:yes gene_type:complete
VAKWKAGKVNQQKNLASIDPNTLDREADLRALLNTKGFTDAYYDKVARRLADVQTRFDSIHARENSKKNALKAKHGRRPTSRISSHKKPVSHIASGGLGSLGITGAGFSVSAGLETYSALKESGLASDLISVVQAMQQSGISESTLVYLFSSFVVGSLVVIGYKIVN